MAVVSGTKPPLPPAAAPRKAAPVRSVALDEVAETARFDRLKKRIKIQAWMIGLLSFVLVVVLPFAQPVYIYYAKKPDDRMMQMIGLDMPNMTNRAILSWTTTAIIEVMTMGFGDIDVKMPLQKRYFTKAGWRVYTESFTKMEIGKTIKQSQLVLTTVPSNTPVIVDQGINPDQVYQWTVQMPIIMTYATNNDVTVEKKAIVTMTLIRVAAEDSPYGVAIQQWVIAPR